jgi:hypothetical protein
MNRYTVHLFPVVRVTVDRIEARTPVEAIRKALDDGPDLEALLRREMPVATEFTEDVMEALVDIEGDTEHAQSRYYENRGDAWRPVEVSESSPCSCASASGTCRKIAILSSACRLALGHLDGDDPGLVGDLALRMRVALDEAGREDRHGAALAGS